MLRQGSTRGTSTKQASRQQQPVSECWSYPSQEPRGMSPAQSSVFLQHVLDDPSSEIVGLQNKRTSAALELEIEQKNLDTLRQQRDELTGQRSKVEAERRHFEELTVTQGNQELFDVERKIAEASNGVVRAKAEAEAAKNMLNNRTKQIESLQNQGEQIQNNFQALPTAIRNLTAQKASLEERFEEANAKAEKLSTALQNTRESLSADAKIHESLDADIAALEKELSTFIATSKGSSAKLDLTASHLQ